MATINFPNNPVDGQLFTFGTKTWKWVAARSVWDLVSAPEAYAIAALASKNAAADSLAAVQALFFNAFDLDGGSPSTDYSGAAVFDGGTP